MALPQITNPYKAKPDYCFWRRGVSRVPWMFLDPVVGHNTFQITPNLKVASAGSCFAQHIAAELRRCGYNYFVAEDGMENMTFSANYGNLYTARQLLQLFERAFDQCKHPIRAHLWSREDGLWVDAFRPTVCSARSSAGEAAEDRKEHLKSVRRLFQTIDVFIFTLGLTECWESTRDGMVYPVHPTAVNAVQLRTAARLFSWEKLGGLFSRTFDWGTSMPNELLQFHNFSCREVLGDLSKFVTKLRVVNPRVKIILTVSPVPLIATYEDRHILVSNTYSKSVLRAAAQEICGSFKDVTYFPAYEIITGTYTKGRFYADDLREVLPEGVRFVMKKFMQTFSDYTAVSIQNNAIEGGGMEDIICDEELYD